MRPGWTVPAVILLMLMLTFIYVPLPYSQTFSLYASGPVGSSRGPVILYCPQVLPSSTPSPSYCLPASAPATVSWTGGNASTWVEIVQCSTFTCQDYNASPTVGPRLAYPWYAVGRGPSGTLSVWLPTASSVMLFTNSTTGVSVTFSWNVMPEFTVIWELFAVLGLILGMVGTLLPPRPRRSRKPRRVPPPGEFGED